jgi:hypothetical protein
MQEKCGYEKRYEAAVKTRETGSRLIVSLGLQRFDSSRPASSFWRDLLDEPH